MMSLWFGVSATAVKLFLDALGLDYSGLSGFRETADLSFDLLCFLPACVVAYEGAVKLPRVLRGPFLSLVLILIWVVIITDILTLKYFRENVFVIVPQLAKLGVLDAAVGNQFNYISGWLLIGSIILVAGLFRPFSRIHSDQRSLIAPSFLVILGFFVVVRHDSLFQASLNALVDNGIYYNDDEDSASVLPDKPLHNGQHSTPIAASAPLLAPKTIIILINELLPWNFGSSGDVRIPLFNTLMAESGLPDSEWVVFPHAFTNSSATDISVPSILTGADPTAGTDNVQAMPLVYAMAKMRGYQTAFFTSQDYGWLNMRPFFSSKQLDVFLSGEMTGQPGANLLGIDDLYVADKICALIRSVPRDRPLFLVLNNNALHVPYQTKAEIPVPDFGGDLKRKAAFILEEDYRRIYRSLQETDRLKGSLIFVTSDHGEGHPLRKRVNARLDSHYDEVINIPYAVRLPSGIQGALRRSLESNRDRLVENMDIAPTLAQFFGFRLPSPLAYGGRSLFGALGDDRVNVSVSNNEWKHYLPKAFGLAWRNDRFVYSDRLGPQYFDVSKDPDEALPITNGKRFDFYLAYVQLHPPLPKYMTHASDR
jgi:phosphoglycerol transferase MdoB-like AlkP superfamily enzyme